MTQQKDSINLNFKVTGELATDIKVHCLKNSIKPLPNYYESCLEIGHKVKSSEQLLNIVQDFLILSKNT